MPTIRCNQCGQTLLVPDDKVGQSVRCPKCRFKFRLRPQTSGVANENSTDAATGQWPDTGDSDAGPEVSYADVDATEQNQKQENDQPPAFFKWFKRLVALADIKFDRYLTPWIIRFTWICVLLLAVLWLIYLGGQSVGDLFSSEQSESESTGSLDINQLLDGGGDLTSLLQRTDDRSWFARTASRIVWTATGGVTLVLSVMWMRVTLEVLIVIFNISKTLESIEEKVDRGESNASD